MSNIVSNEIKVPWLKELPGQSKIIRLRYLCSITTGDKNTEDKQEAGEYPFFVRSQTIEHINSYSYDGLGILTAGDGVGVGKVFHIIDGKFDFHQRVYLFHKFSELVVPKYLFYYLKTNLIRDLKRYNAKSTVDSVRLPILKDFPVLVHSLPKQNAIATYLDFQLVKISHFIQKKEQFIELLKEQRQGIINKAVTKGIDPTVKLKDSGIDWLGEIREHWEVRRLRYCGTCQNGLNKGGEYFGSGHPFFGYGDIYNNAILPTPSGLVQSNESDHYNCSVQKGDVFFTRTSEVVEEIAISSTCFESVDQATFSGFLIRFRPLENMIDPLYSSYLFRAQFLRNYFVKEMNIMTRASLSQDTLKNLWVILPPITEQIAIGLYLNKETSKIDQAISKAEREIELIKEYKEAMIAEAVLGKLEIPTK